MLRGEILLNHSIFMPTSSGGALEALDDLANKPR
jgi:hypothetical protein